jgi:hypothetical protein
MAAKKMHKDFLPSLNGAHNRGMQPIYGGMEAAQAKQGIAEGIASMERGEGKPAETVFARLREKHGFKAKR